MMDFILSNLNNSLKRQTYRVKFKSKNKDYYFFRTIIVPNDWSYQRSTKFLSKSLREIEIISIESSKSICLVNDTKKFTEAHYNEIEYYWIDGTEYFVELFSDDYKELSISISVVGGAESTEMEIRKKIKEIFKMSDELSKKLVIDAVYDCWVKRTIV